MLMSCVPSSNTLKPQLKCNPQLYVSLAETAAPFFSYFLAQSFKSRTLGIGIIHYFYRQKHYCNITVSHFNNKIRN